MATSPRTISKSLERQFSFGRVGCEENCECRKSMATPKGADWLDPTSGRMARSDPPALEMKRNKPFGLCTESQLIPYLGRGDTPKDFSPARISDWSASSPRH